MRWFFTVFCAGVKKERDDGNLFTRFTDKMTGGVNREADLSAKKETEKKGTRFQKENVDEERQKRS